MSTNYTPGPWKSLGGTGSVWSEERFVASVYGDDPNCRPDSRMRANGMLIAAAPDLLEALRNLLDEGEFTDYPNTREWYAVKAAREAIAKATGSTP